MPTTGLSSVRNTLWNSYSNLIDNFRARHKMAAMEEELQRLRHENMELRYKLRRHENFREALNLPRDEDYPTLPAIVLFQDDRLTRSLIINRGESDGIEINMPVWTGEGLVGRTSRVSALCR